MKRSMVLKVAGAAGVAGLLVAPVVVVPLAGAETGPPEVGERRVLSTEHVDGGRGSGERVAAARVRSPCR